MFRVGEGFFLAFAFRSDPKKYGSSCEEMRWGDGEFGTAIKAVAEAATLPNLVRGACCLFLYLLTHLSSLPSFLHATSVQD